MEPTTPSMWLGIIVSLAFWGLIIAGISFLVAKAVVRQEMKRMTFSSSEPVRPEATEPERPPTDRL